MSRKKTKNSPENSFTEFLLYTTPDNKVKVEIFLKDENIWLTQDKIAELFGVQRPAITKHLKNIFASGELVKDSVSSIMELTTQDGKSYKTNFYNLDAIISVGYRVNSRRATRFRQWATQVLREFAIKGFVLDDERVTMPGIKPSAVACYWSTDSKRVTGDLLTASFAPVFTGWRSNLCYRLMAHKS